MKKAIRIIAVGLVMVLLAACGNGSGDSGNGGGGNGGGGNDPDPGYGSDVIDRPPSPYDFQETWMDLDGRFVTMIVNASRNLWDYDLYDIDRTPNDTLRVIDILREIQEEYNFTLEIERHPSAGFLNMLREYRIAGDTPFDIVEVGLTDFGVDGLWLFNLAMPVNHPAIVDIIMPDENPWPGAGFSTIGDTQWAVHFRPFNSPTVLGPTLIFNETLRARLGLPNFYDLVRNDEWTWDRFDSLLGEISNVSGGSIYPVIYSGANAIMPSFIASNNGHITVNTEAGFQFVGDTNENALEAMNFLVNNIAERNFFHPISPIHGHGISIAREVADGEALFIFDYYAMLRNLRDQNPGYETDYVFGLLPPPRGPRADGYISVLYAEVLYHIVNDIDRPEQIAAVLVAMANRTIQRPYLVLEHELRYTLHTNASGEMLELMLNNVVIDISRVVAASRTAGDHGTTGAANRILGMRATPIQSMQEMVGSIQDQFNTVNDMIAGIFLGE